MVWGPLPSVVYDCSLLLAAAAFQFCVHYLIILAEIDERTGIVILFLLTSLVMLQLDRDFIYVNPGDTTFGVTATRFATHWVLVLVVSELIMDHCTLRHVIRTSETLLVCPWDNPKGTGRLGRFILHFYILTIGRTFLASLGLIVHLFSLMWNGLFRRS